MKTRNTIFAAFIALLIPLSLSGQAVSSSYFVDNSLQRVRLNPAFSPDCSVGYVGLLVSGVSANIGSNMATEDFLFNKNGQLYTYLNKNVTVEEFAERIKTDPTLNMKINEELLGLGFRIGPAYITAGVGLRVDMDMNLPKDLLILTKQGMATTDQSYDFSGLSLMQAAFLEGQIGASIDLSMILPGLSIGGRAKYLMAADYIGLKINEGTLRMSDEKWMIKTDAEAVVGAKGVEYKDGGIYFPNGRSGVGFCGRGLLFDVGAEYKLNLELGALTGINVSFAMTDIGKCTVTDRFTTIYKSAGEAEFEGLKGIKPGDDISTSLDNVIDDFVSIANVEKTDDQKAIAFNFTPAIRAGLEVSMFNNNLSTGFLYTRDYGFDELRIIESVKLGGRFNAAISYGLLNTHDVGFYIGYTPRRHGINIYFAEEGFPTRYTMPDANGMVLPLGKLNTSGRFGINICFETRDRK
ncbi:MAG: hypothetical protein IJS91_01330 [Bacteroidales bacterium]|nr:hypothetical protein [Bacteroidales bacterium]